MNIPTQNILKNSVAQIPVEYFVWGNYPDHFKIDMPHRHKFAELLFFTKGGGTHEIDYKDNKILDNAIHFIPSSVVHFLKRDQQSDGFTIAFDPEYLELNKIHRMIAPSFDIPFVLNLKPEAYGRILVIANLLHDQIRMRPGYIKSKCFLLSIELLLHSILGELKAPKDSSSSPTQEDPLLARFTKLVQTNVHLRTNVKWYAQELKLSPKYLSNHVKKMSSKSAKELISQYLLVSLKRALINSNMSIKEIAIAHNYSSASLCKFFKRNVGHTMSEYRINKLSGKMTI